MPNTICLHKFIISLVCPLLVVVLHLAIGEAETILFHHVNTRGHSYLRHFINI